MHHFVHRPLHRYNQAKTLPTREVTVEEFRQAAHAVGITDPEIDTAIFIQREIGAESQVGSEMLRIKDVIQPGTGEGTPAPAESGGHSPSSSVASEQGQ